jgi:hypothetical protein
MWRRRPALEWWFSRLRGHEDVQAAGIVLVDNPEHFSNMFTLSGQHRLASNLQGSVC